MPSPPAARLSGVLATGGQDARKLQLDSAIDAAGSTVSVPWQDCALPTDDFLVVRLMEIVVHADDLALTPPGVSGDSVS